MLLNILFPLTAMGLIGAAAWYTPFRLARLFGAKRVWPFCLGAGVMVGLSIAGMVAWSHSANVMIGHLATAAGLCFGLFIYLTFFVLGLHIIGGWLGLANRKTAWLATGLALLVTAAGAWQANSFVVTETEIPITGLKQDITLMHIADLHFGPHRGRAYLEKIVDATNRHNPDLALLNGDLVDSNIALAPGVLSALGRFTAPVYFTTGNHEAYVDTARVLEILARQGIRILHNEVVKTHGIQLVGLDYMNADENTFDMHAVNKLTIKAELPKIPLEKGIPAVLMHHSPVGLEYVEAQGIALMLSGHTHGGQIFPATLLNRFIFPLNKGLHRHGETYFFVSQGAGTYGPRMRLGTANEINLIRLTAKQG